MKSSFISNLCATARAQRSCVRIGRFFAFVSVLFLLVCQAEFPRTSLARAAGPNSGSQVILASDPTLGALFGTTVDVEGDTLIVGAPDARNTNDVARGAAYIYTNETGSWQFQARLEAPVGAPGFNFGHRVAIDGGTVVISGTPNVYTYVRVSGQWTLQQTLSPEPNFSGSGFGSDVTIDGDTIIVGASGAIIDGTSPGAAYIFVREGGQWTRTTKLIDAGCGGQFGSSVGVSGDTVVVGAPFGNIQLFQSQGIICIFKRKSEVWTLQGRLTGSDTGIDDKFGTDVAIEGDTMLIGAENYSTTGAAYVLTRSGDTWTEQQKLLAPSGITSLNFGSSVDMSADRLLVGDRRGMVNGTEAAGAAYAYAFAGGGWVLQNRLVAPDGSNADFLGTGVAVDGRRYFGGAPNRDTAEFPNQGAVYYFSESPSAPDLRPSLDTGLSNSDNITSIQDLVFDVSGIDPGATVELLRNGVVVDSEVVAGTTAVFTDTPPHNSVHQYATRQMIGGQFSSPSDTVIVTLDNTAPVAYIAKGPFQADPTVHASCEFRLLYNESIRGFEISDVSFAGSTANLANATITHTNSPASDTLRVDNIVSDGQIVKASLPAGSVFDIAGNPNNLFQPEDNTVLIDNVRPTVTVNQSSSQADPTTSLPLRYTAVFSESVTGFTASDVSVTSQGGSVIGNVVNVSGAGPTYEIAVSNLSLNGFPVHVRIALHAAQDALGNASAESTSTDNIVTLDNAGPTVSVGRATGQQDPTASPAVNFRVVFNEAVVGFDASDVTLAGSTANVEAATIVVTGSGTTYNIAVDNIVSDRQIVRAGVVAGAVTDGFGNPSTASTGNASITVDNVAPAVTVDQAIGQSDPATVQPVNFILIFSEPITGLTAADISLAGSTAGVSAANISVTGLEDIWNVAVSNVLSSGTVRVSVVAGAVQDALGNLSTASQSADDSIELLVPTLASIQGKVTDLSGRGLARVRIKVELPSGGILYAQTNHFGYFRLAGVPTGQVTIIAERKNRPPSSVTFNLLGDVTNMNFSFL